MKSIFSVLLAMLFALTAMAGGVSLKGTLVTADGKPVADGLVTYTQTGLQSNAETKTIRTDNQGQFEIPMDGNDYNLTFSKWGYEPLFKRLNSHQIEAQSEVKVVLGHYDLPYGPFKLALESQDYDWDQAIEFQQDGEAWVAKVKTDQPSLKYQVVVDNKRSLHGPDPAGEADSSGDMISEAKATNGEVVVRITPDTFTFKADQGSYWQNISGVGYVTTKDAIYENEALRERLREKYQSNELTLTGIEAEYEALTKQAAQVPIADQKLLAQHAVESTFRAITKEEGKREALLQRIKEDPAFIMRLGGQSAVMMKVDMIHEANGVDEQEAEASPRYKEAGEALLSLEAPESFRLDVLGMLSLFANYYDHKEAEQLYADKILSEYPESRAATRIQKQAEQNAMIGKPAPDFTLIDPDGNEKSLSDFRGKYVVLDFWATWCSPCIAAMPGLAEAYAEIDKSKVEFLGVALDVQGKPLKRAMKKHKMTWPNIGDQGSWDAPVAKLYNINSIPKMMLLDPQGNIMDFDPRRYEGKALVEKLNEIVKAATTKADAGSSTAGGDR